MFVSVGDRVRLTGPGWNSGDEKHLGTAVGTVHEVISVDRKNGFAWIFEDGERWVVLEEGLFAGEKETTSQR